MIFLSESIILDAENLLRILESITQDMYGKKNQEYRIELAPPI